MGGVWASPGIKGHARFVARVEGHLQEEMLGHGHAGATRLRFLLAPGRIGTAAVDEEALKTLVRAAVSLNKSTPQS
jgi:hypothetical protein